MFPTLKAGVCAALIAGALLATGNSQTVKQTNRKPRMVEQDANPAVSEAEAAIDKRDFGKAEDLLLKTTNATPKEYRAWFYLGYVYAATNRRAQAIDAYKKAAEIKPDSFESNLNAGQLLGAEGKLEDSAKFLRAATHLKPEGNSTENLAKAWTLLGAALEKSDPKQSAAAYEEASKLQPKNADALLALARTQEAANDLAEAEASYRKVLELQPENAEAIAALADILNREGKAEAETMIRRLLEKDPKNANARLVLGRVLLKNGKADEALPELEMALQARPSDAELVKQVVQLYIDAQKYDAAAELLKKVVAASPKSAALHYQLGLLLMKARNFKDAQEQFLTAIDLDGNLTDAYGNLAIVASENKDYVLSIKALDFRAKLAPENPATIFLRATAYDHLRSPKEASKYYREFLTAANGRFPDQEFQARHRLIAIDPTYEGKKKK